MMNIKKALLNQEPQTLRVLHNAELIDFTKKVDFLQINGRFTVKAAEKAAAEAGYFPNDSIIVLLTTGAKYNEERIYITKLTGLTGYKVDYKIYQYTDGRHYCKIDNFYSKGRFEEVRKQDGITTYIVCQKKADLTQENPHPVNLANRFKVENVRKWCYQYGGADYIGEIETRRTDDNGSKYTYNKRGPVIIKGKDEYKTLDEVIDKSGYIVNLKRDELKRRAAGLRADRAKTAYKATNNTAKLEELKKQIEAKKAAIIEELTNATTGAQLNSIGHKIYFYNGLSGIMSDFERLSARDAQKDYSNISNFESAYNSIVENLKNI